jgi:hypothetical protein
MHSPVLARPTLIVGGAVVLVVGAGAVAYQLRASADSSPAASASQEALTSATSATTPASTSTASPTVAVSNASADQARAAILTKATLHDAIETARPFMESTTGRLDVGSALLTLWASKHLKAGDVAALPETTPALFQKDPEAERGKRLCFSGVIAQIRAEKDLGPRLIDDRPQPLIAPAAPKPTAEPTLSPASSDAGVTPPVLPPPASPDYLIPDSGKVFVATLDSKPVTPPQSASSASPKPSTPAPPPEAVEVIAVGSTGTLVNGDEARVCGVLTGVTLLVDDASTTSTEQPRYRIVGYFEEADKTPPPSPPVAHRG